jgi:hypothetical protein
LVAKRQPRPARPGWAERQQILIANTPGSILGVIPHLELKSAVQTAEQPNQKNDRQRNADEPKQ